MQFATVSKERRTFPFNIRFLLSVVKPRQIESLGCGFLSLKTGCGRVSFLPFTPGLGKAGRVTFAMPSRAGKTSPCAYMCARVCVRTSYGCVRPHPGSTRRLMNDQASCTRRAARHYALPRREASSFLFVLLFFFFIRSTFLPQSRARMRFDEIYPNAERVFLCADYHARLTHLSSFSFSR